MLTQNYKPDWDAVMQMLGVTAKNTWFYTKTLAGSTLGQGAQFLVETGHMLSGLYAEAIKTYMEKTAERAMGIIVARNDGEGLVVHTVYTTPSASSRQIPWWNILPAAAHVFGLDPKASDTQEKYGRVLNSDISDIPVVTRCVGGLRSVEIVEDYSEENEDVECAGPGQLKPGSRLLDSDDDGSFLIIVLDRGNEKDQLKEIERGISECRLNVTVRKKSDVAKSNAKVREKSDSPLMQAQQQQQQQQQEQPHHPEQVNLQSILNNVPLFSETNGDSEEPIEKSIQFEFDEDGY